MRRIPTTFEVLVSAILLFLGLYMLNEGSSTKSTNAPATLIGGAVFFTLSAMNLIFAVRSILWHRRMLRGAKFNHGLDATGPGHNR